MKERVVLPAWELITEFHSLKKLNFIPSFFGMLWLFLILIYQITFTYVFVFHKKDEFLGTLASFAHKEYFNEVLIGLAGIFLLYMILEPIALGGIIQMIDSYRKHGKEKAHHTFQGIFDGFRHFLPIFEVQNITAIFRPLSIITFYILLLRVFGLGYFTSITITMAVYLLLAFFINMCFAYSKFFIIFEGKRALESLSASTGLAVRHIGITGQLYFTMILLYLRTIIVALIFLVLPFIVSSIIAFFTIMAVKMIFLGIFAIISLILFIFIVHLNSTLEIFIEATWYEAYQLCKKEDAEYGGPTEHHDENAHHDDHGHGWYDAHGHHH
jgi:hypothetical protein